MGIELLGTDELITEIRKKLGNASQRLENKALRKAGEPISEAMKSHVNVSDRETTHLKEEIKVSGVRRDKFAGTRYVKIGAGKKTGWRGHFLEYGTVKMPTPRPWASAGFDEGKDEAKQIIKEEFRKGLEE